MLYPSKLGSSITGESCPNTSKLNPSAKILNKVNICYKFYCSGYFKLREE
jgi:hypothetical protein